MYPILMSKYTKHHSLDKTKKGDQNRQIILPIKTFRETLKVYTTDQVYNF